MEIVVEQVVLLFLIAIMLVMGSYMIYKYVSTNNDTIQMKVDFVDFNKVFNINGYNVTSIPIFDFNKPNELVYTKVVIDLSTMNINSNNVSVNVTLEGEATNTKVEKTGLSPKNVQYIDDNGDAHTVFGVDFTEKLPADKYHVTISIKIDDAWFDYDLGYIIVNSASGTSYVVKVSEQNDDALHSSTVVTENVMFECSDSSMDSLLMRFDYLIMGNTYISLLDDDLVLSDIDIKDRLINKDYYVPFIIDDLEYFTVPIVKNGDLGTRIDVYAIGTAYVYRFNSNTGMNIVGLPNSKVRLRSYMISIVDSNSNKVIFSAIINGSNSNYVRNDNGFVKDIIVNNGTLEIFFNDSMFSGSSGSFDNINIEIVAIPSKLPNTDLYIDLSKLNNYYPCHSNVLHTCTKHVVANVIVFGRAFKSYSLTKNSIKDYVNVELIIPKGFPPNNKLSLYFDNSIISAIQQELSSKKFDYMVNKVIISRFNGQNSENMLLGVELEIFNVMYDVNVKYILQGNGYKFGSLSNNSLYYGKITNYKIDITPYDYNYTKYKIINGYDLEVDSFEYKNFVYKPQVRNPFIFTFSGAQTYSDSVVLKGFKINKIDLPADIVVNGRIIDSTTITMYSNPSDVTISGDSNIVENTLINANLYKKLKYNVYLNSERSDIYNVVDYITLIKYDILLYNDMFFNISYTLDKIITSKDNTFNLPNSYNDYTIISKHLNAINGNTYNFGVVSGSNATFSDTVVIIDKQDCTAYVIPVLIYNIYFPSNTPVMYATLNSQRVYFDPLITNVEWRGENAVFIRTKLHNVLDDAINVQLQKYNSIFTVGKDDTLLITDNSVLVTQKSVDGTPISYVYYIPYVEVMVGSVGLLYTPFSDINIISEHPTVSIIDYGIKDSKLELNFKEDIHTIFGDQNFVKELVVLDNGNLYLPTTIYSNVGLTKTATFDNVVPSTYKVFLISSIPNVFVYVGEITLVSDIFSSMYTLIGNYKNFALEHTILEKKEELNKNFNDLSKDNVYIYALNRPLVYSQGIPYIYDIPLPVGGDFGLGYYFGFGIIHNYTVQHGSLSKDFSLFNQKISNVTIKVYRINENTNTKLTTIWEGDSESNPEILKYEELTYTLENNEKLTIRMSQIRIPIEVLYYSMRINYGTVSSDLRITVKVNTENPLYSKTIDIVIKPYMVFDNILVQPTLNYGYTSKSIIVFDTFASYTLPSMTIFKTNKYANNVVDVIQTTMSVTSYTKVGNTNSNVELLLPEKGTLAFGPNDSNTLNYKTSYFFGYNVVSLIYQKDKPIVRAVPSSVPPDAKYVVDNYINNGVELNHADISINENAIFRFYAYKINDQYYVTITIIRDGNEEDLNTFNLNSFGGKLRMTLSNNNFRMEVMFEVKDNKLFIYYKKINMNK